MDQAFTFTVNGKQATVTADPERPLLGILREDLGLTGAKLGCGEGQCGACTVIVDGKREHACQLPVKDVAGKTVVTIEGLATGERLHPVQSAFLAEAAMQCGFCTPGMVLSTVALLKTTPRPSDAQVLDWMNSHICRCCGYPRILKAVKRAAAEHNQPL